MQLKTTKKYHLFSLVLLLILSLGAQNAKPIEPKEQIFYGAGICFVSGTCFYGAYKALDPNDKDGITAKDNERASDCAFLGIGTLAYGLVVMVDGMRRLVVERP